MTWNTQFIVYIVSATENKYLLNPGGINVAELGILHKFIENFPCSGTWISNHNGLMCMRGNLYAVEITDHGITDVDSVRIEIINIRDWSNSWGNYSIPQDFL